jgi:hypothetical protein
VRYRIIERVTYAVTVLLLVGGCGWALVTWGPSLACEHLSLLCPAPPGAQELAPFVDEYLGAAGPEIDAEEYTIGLNYEPPLTLPPYRIGRIAAVNVVDRVIDGELTRALPAELVATRPADVGTVIWVRWGETHEGTYHDEGTQQVSGEAYRGYCAVVVIDLAAGEIVGRAYYAAPSPPTTTTGSGDVHTEVDVELVANWIKTLPVRDSSPTPAPPTPAPSPSGVESAALEPGESVTLSGDQAGRDVVVPADSFELLAGDYSVVFKGRASNGCSSCMAVKVFNELDEYPIFVVNEPARIGVGRWEFSGVFTLANWEEGTFHLELSMPKGTWTVTLTRDP